MDKKGQGGKQRDRPEVKEGRIRIRDRLVRWAGRWGADLLLVCGAGCIAAGTGWIFPPAGLITAGALLIIGGVLWARGGGGP